jgi:sterol desaturase/sphingolipid hydroxylase (fatty acid hydroxylase superfamily)
MQGWLYYFLVFFVIILLRYFLVAGGTYLLFHHLSGFQASLKKINPNWQSIKKDIHLSIMATIVLANCAAWGMMLYQSGATLLYQSINDYGVVYLIISFLGVIFLQDTCYYFFHRILHHPLLFYRLHRGHHRSQYPTPWTSFALDFSEALMQGLFIIGVIMIIPLHWSVLVLWLLTMTIWAVVNHLGFELFPRFPHHWLGKWLISANHHTLHHRYYNQHYGLYFTFWDRLLGTQ